MQARALLWLTGCAPAWLCCASGFACNSICWERRISEADWLRGLQWDRNGTNMLAGTLSWLAGCALWVTSLAWVRRNYFEVRRRLCWLRAYCLLSIEAQLSLPHMHQAHAQV